MIAGIGAEGHRTGFDGVLFQRRKGAVDEEDRAGGADVAGRAEGPGGAQILGRLIDIGALCAVERHLLAIGREHVLAQELSQFLEGIAHAPDDRVVAPDGVRRLGPVDDVEDDQCEGGDADEEDEQRCQDDEGVDDDFRQHGSSSRHDPGLVMLRQGRRFRSPLRSCAARPRGHLSVSAVPAVGAICASASPSARSENSAGRTRRRGD